MAVPQSFPAKIYQILENESPEIIQWNENGLSFRIVDHARFEREIVPKYFRHNQISSVQRQLNLYGFKCISRGEYKRSFFHPKFRRGDWDTVKTLTRYVPVKKNTPTPSQQGDDGSEAGKDPRGGGGMHPFMPYMYPYHPNMPPNQQLAAMMHHGYALPPNAGNNNGPWSDSWNRPSNASAQGNMSPSMANGIAMYQTHGNMPPAQMSPSAYMHGPPNMYHNVPSPRPMDDNASVASSVSAAPGAMSHDPGMVAATAAAASHYGGAGAGSLDVNSRAGGVMGNQYFGAALPQENFKPVPNVLMPPTMLPAAQQQPLHHAYNNQSLVAPNTVGPAMPYSRASSNGNLPGGADYDLMVEFGMFDSFAIPDSLGNSRNASVGPTAAPSVVNLPSHGEAPAAVSQLLPATSAPCADYVHSGGHSVSSVSAASAAPRGPDLLAHPASLQCHDSSQSSVSSPSHTSPSANSSIAGVPAVAAVQCDAACNTELTYDPVTDSFVRRSDL